MTHQPPVVVFDWQAFREHVERLRVKHDTRPPAEAVAASLAAFERWGVSPPRSFFEQHPEVVAARPVVPNPSRARSTAREDS